MLSSNEKLQRALVIASEAVQGTAKLVDEPGSADHMMLATKAVEMGGAIAQNNITDDTEKLEAGLITDAAFLLTPVIFSILSHHKKPAPEQTTQG